MLIFLFQTLSALYLSAVTFGCYVRNISYLQPLIRACICAYRTCNRILFQIRREPDVPNWLSISYLKKVGDGKGLKFHEAYFFTEEDAEKNDFVANMIENDYLIAECLITSKYKNKYTFRVVPFHASLQKLKQCILSTNLTKNLEDAEKLVNVQSITSPFLNIEYQACSRPNIQIKIPKEYYELGNVLFSSTFLARYFQYTFGSSYFSRQFSNDYKLILIDTMINITELINLQSIEMTNDGYKIHTKVSDKYE